MMSGKFTAVIWTRLLERERVLTFSTGTAELHKLCYVNWIFYFFPRTVVLTWTCKLLQVQLNMSTSLSYRYPLYGDKLLCLHWYGWSSPAYLWLSSFPHFGVMQSSLARENNTALSLLFCSSAQQVEHSSHDLLLGLWKSLVCLCNYCSSTPLFTVWSSLLP